MDSLPVATQNTPPVSEKHYLSRETSPTNSKTQIKQEQPKPLQEFNDEVFEMLNKLDMKQFSITSLETEVDVLKQKYIAVHGEQLEKKLDSLCNVFNAIKKLIERCYKQIFKTYNQSMATYGIPKKQSVLMDLDEYLEVNVISSRISDELDAKIKKSIRVDCQIFIYLLTQIPGMYVTFFEKEFFPYLENIDILEDTIDLHLCKDVLIKKIMTEVTTLLSVNSDYIIKITNFYYEAFIEMLNSKVAMLFQECKSAMTKYITEFRFATEKASLVNRFIIIGLLRELSKKCREHINEILQESFFALVEPDLVNNFATFIIQCNELFDLTYEKHCDAALYFEMDNEELGKRLTAMHQPPVKKTLQQLIQEKLQKIMKEKEKLVICNCIRKDGHHGYFIERSDGMQYLMHKNASGDLVLLNAKYMSDGWRKEEQDDQSKTLKSFEQLIQQVKDKKEEGNFLNEDGKNLPPPDLNKSSPIYVNSAAGDLGSSLGYCLANINKYQSTTDFLKDFGKIATINGSITYIVQKLPLVGTLLMVGGLGFSTYQLYQNKVANNKSKMGQIGKMALGTGSAITGSFSGALIGQAVIPVPILGAFIGGVIGGIIGGTSSNYAIQMLNKSKFNLMIAKIEKSIHPEGYWSYSRDMLNRLGITNKYFQKSLPENLLTTNIDRQDQWMTMCCYGMLSTYYSTLEQKEREKLQKKLKKANNEKEQEEIIAQLEYQKEWVPAIQNSQLWLLSKDIIVLAFLSEVEDFIKTVISSA